MTTATTDLVTGAVAAHTAGVAIEDYLAARDTGATHTEVVIAAQAGIDLYEYTCARRAGFTHSEMLRAQRLGYRLLGYVNARRAGATPDEIAHAHAQQIDLDDYAYVRDVPVCHVDVIVAAEHLGRDLYTYANVRRRHADHADILDAAAQGFPLYNLLYGLEQGATIAELTAARTALGDSHWNLNDYLHRRRQGAPHHSALAGSKA